MQEQQHFCTLYLVTTLESKKAPAPGCAAPPQVVGAERCWGTRAAALGWRVWTDGLCFELLGSGATERCAWLWNTGSPPSAGPAPVHAVPVGRGSARGSFPVPTGAHGSYGHRAARRLGLGTAARHRQSRSSAPVVGPRAGPALCELCWGHRANGKRRCCY